MTTIISNTPALQAFVLVQAAAQRHASLPSRILPGMFTWTVETADRRQHGPYPSLTLQYEQQDKNEPIRPQ
jgi:Spy/CpxP family protein refolding chaperone